ncbi:hypothetical protein [Kitasatospora sp. NPDC087314]
MVADPVTVRPVVAAAEAAVEVGTSAGAGGSSGTAEDAGGGEK